ncbi:hypothetical protein F2Q65_11510 [Thiohalocapsa marina]|uniref:Uncharacterized protein n=1 Tax=Thiohalocapsa marina TaxID=424902 RepID=A0A5M8FJ62_9GAMM|nr:hypothetical protein [Thiohalocapsa marina]KAA6184717.1 hypothetical protein F2Q65_11510 [Thiohalocapsa marina]
MISHLGEFWAANLLRLLGLVALLAWIMVFRDIGLDRRGVVAGALLAYSSLVIVLPSSDCLLHETWAATLMALALAYNNAGGG